MSLQLIVDKTEEILKEVTDIGRVHKFRRSTYFWENYYENHTQNGQVRNWEITRRAFDIAPASTDNLYFEIHLMTIFGWMSLNDDIESETTFQALIESIRAAFLTGSNKFLDGEIAFFADVRVPIIDHVAFGSQAVHFCEIQFEARERVVRP